MPLFQEDNQRNYHPTVETASIFEGGPLSLFVTPSKVPAKKDSAKQPLKNKEALMDDEDDISSSEVALRPLTEDEVADVNAYIVSNKLTQGGRDFESGKLRLTLKMVYGEERYETAGYAELGDLPLSGLCFLEPRHRPDALRKR